MLGGARCDRRSRFVRQRCPRDDARVPRGARRLRLPAARLPHCVRVHAPAPCCRGRFVCARPSALLALRPYGPIVQRRCRMGAGRAYGLLCHSALCCLAGVLRYRHSLCAALWIASVSADGGHLACHPAPASSARCGAVVRMLGGRYARSSVFACSGCRAGRAYL